MFNKFNPVTRIKHQLQRSIQSKLAFILLLVGFISLSSLGYLSVWLGRQEVESEVGKRNREVASLVSGQVQTYLAGIVSDLKFASSYFSAPDTGPEPNSIYVFRLLKKNSDQTYQTLAYIDRNGVRRAFFAGSLNDMDQAPTTDSNLDQSSVDMSKDPAYLTTKAGKIYYSPITFSADKITALMVVAVPVVDSKDTFLGSLIIEANLSHLLDILQTVRTDQTTEAKLVDGNGIVFACSMTSMIGSQIPASQLGDLQAKSQSMSEYSENGEVYLAGYAPVAGQAGWGVIVSQAASEALSGITRLAVIALCVVIAAIIVLSFIAVFLSKNITRPVRELATAANRITTTGNLDEQIPITSQDEVGELTASFNGMIMALRKTRMALEHWNRELERKVDARTQELTRSNEKLEQINDQLERANLHKTQFLANMSHELRTPLNAIIGFSEVLQDQLFGELNERQVRYVNNISSSGRHLLNLVNDVLDLSKVEAGKMELHWEELAVPQCISEVITQLGTLAAKKELALQSEVEPGLDTIVADRSRFRQILYNLVSNAIKFTPQNGRVEIRGRIDCTDLANRMAVFEVADTGIGINEDDLEKIFDSFQQVDSSYSRQYQGTGLGLALTRKLVEMHGGKIVVTSEPGVGSTFSFTIPLVGAENQPVPVVETLVKASGN